MNFLEYRAIKEEAKAYASGLVEEITARIDRMEVAMAEQIDRLNTAVDKELADDAAQNELIAELKRQLEAAAQAAADAQAGQAGAEQALTDALTAAGAAADKLGTNDLVEEPPAEPTP